METREGYKKTKIGWIPEDWKFVSLDEANLSIIDGDRGTNYPKQNDYTEEGFCLFLTAKNVTKNGFKFEETQFISKDKDLLLRKGKLQRNDIVITTRGTVGNIAWYSPGIKFKHLRINSGMAIIRQGEVAHHMTYIYLLLRSYVGQDQIQKIAFGSAQPQLTIKEIKKFRVPLPPLPEQKKIASILSTVDEKIQSIEEQINQTENLKKGLMNKLLTEGIGNTEFKDTKIGRIPKSWAVSSIGETCEIHNNLRKPINSEIRSKMCGQYPYYGPTQIVDYINEYRVEGVYTLIGEDGDHFLKYGSRSMTQYAKGKFNVNNHAHIIKGQGECSTLWVYYYFKNRNIIQSLTRQGAGRYKLNKASLIRMPLVVPPKEEQKKIAEILGSADDKTDILHSKRLAYETLKKGLMAQLLTGQMRVKI